MIIELEVIITNIINIDYFIMVATSFNISFIGITIMVEFINFI